MTAVAAGFSGVARARRLSRAFVAWYAATLIVCFGAVEAALHVRPPDVAVVPDAPIAAEAVVAIPPKPEGVSPDRDVAGSGDGPGYTWERCEKLTAAYGDACFSALARQLSERDPDRGLDACERVGDPELRMECQADVAEGHSLVDVDRSRAICTTIGHKKWRDQCVFGIASAWALKDPAFALKTCEDSGQWRPFCRHDVNGARAQVDPDGAVAYCASLDPAKQDSCWHGIGKYVARIDPPKALDLCAKVTTENDFRGQCAHGVGWAAAETRGPDAISICEPLGDMRDSCVLGVAYQSKRYDPARAAELCGLAHDAGERRHCLDFVERGAR